jgi:hypothetical protein
MTFNDFQRIIKNEMQSFHSAWETQTPTQSLRTGIDLSLFNYIHPDITLFYLNLKFSDIIPFRYGLTWQILINDYAV